EELVAGKLDADGRVPAVEGDSLLVVNQAVSSGGNDAYLHRQVRYSMRIDADSDPAKVVGHLEVVLRNDAPTASAGGDDNQTSLSIYSPFSPDRGTVDGQPVEIHTTAELGRQVHSA